MAGRKRLSDILINSDRERLEQAWQVTDAADELKPIPAGEYDCTIIDGTLFSAKSGTLGYKLTLEVRDGEQAGRRIWHDLWLSEAALPMAKRDLAKLGVERLEQLEQPLPGRIVIKAKVALRKTDDGNEFNRVSRFDAIGVETPEPDPFAPADDGKGQASEADDDAQCRDAGGFNWRTGEQEEESS